MTSGMYYQDFSWSMCMYSRSSAYTSWVPSWLHPSSRGDSFLFVPRHIERFSFSVVLLSDARPVAFVDRLTDVYAFLSDGDCGAWGTGGMYTKVVASKIATNVGVHVAISNGQHPERILDILQYAERSYEVEEEEQEDQGGCGAEGRHLGGPQFPRIPPPRSVLVMASRGDKDGGSKQCGIPLSSSTPHKSPSDDHDENQKRKDLLSREETARNKQGKEPRCQGGGVEDSSHHRRSQGEPEEEARMLRSLPALSLPPSSSSSPSSRGPSSCDGVSCAVSAEGEKGEREEDRYRTRRRSSVASSVEGVKGEGEESVYLTTRRRSSVCSSIDGGIYGGGWQDEDDEDERKSESFFGTPSPPLYESRRHPVGGEEASQGSEVCPSPLLRPLKENPGGEQEQGGLRKNAGEEVEPRDQGMSGHDEGMIACNGKVEGPETHEKNKTSMPDNEILDSLRASTGDANGREVPSSVTPSSGVSSVRSPQQQPFSSLTVCSNLDEMPFLGRERTAS